MPLVWDAFEEAKRDEGTASRRGRPASGSYIPSDHRLIWACVGVFFVGGDLGTTGLGYLVPGVVEWNPSIATVLDTYGFLGMLPLKVIAVLGALFLYRVVPRPNDVAVPLGFAVVGMGVTAWNLVVLSLTVLV